MTSKPLADIAVLMPVYNAGGEIAATLQSLRDQTVPFKLYLVDDGSKSKPDYKNLTRGIDCHIILLPKNLGIIGALNAGLSEILKHDHQFIARLDNGDINSPDRFMKQAAYLNKHPEVSLVGSAICFKYEVTGLTITTKPPLDTAANARALRYNSPVPGASLLIRTSFIRQTDGFPTIYPAAEDYALEWLAYAKGHNINCLPEVLYTSVEMTNSISGGQRRLQLNSRLRLQLHYAAWTNIHTYLGLMRTLLLMVLPVNVIRRIKVALES
jgi:GT2 family glycosyltransferase